MRPSRIKNGVCSAARPQAHIAAIYQARRCTCLSFMATVENAARSATSGSRHQNPGSELDWTGCSEPGGALRLNQVKPSQAKLSRATLMKRLPTISLLEKLMAMNFSLMKIPEIKITVVRAWKQNSTGLSPTVRPSIRRENIFHMGHPQRTV